MEKLSREDENRIISSLERVVGLTNKGTAPNEAIQKIAEEERFGPHVVQRMVEAFNTSKTISHLKHAAGEDRAKSFPIADTASVLENMYPKTVVSPVVKTAMTTVPGELKKAERENFNRILTPSFTFTKVASSIAPDPESAARSCIDELRRTRPPFTPGVNHVRRIYDPFTPAEISAKVAELVYPRGITWSGPLQIIYQTIESLHAAVPHHTGDWYFTGKYPTPGGYRVVNQAYINYFEKHEGRSY